MKTCIKCDVEKDYDFFHKRKDSNDGYRNECKDCRNNFYRNDIEVENNFYVYIHKKESDDEIFYIGKGRFNRAYSKHGRNSFWNNIVNKHGFVVEIILENLTNEEACENEKNYIKKLGRRNLGTGPLVNMTDGGEGVSGSIPWNKGMKMETSWNVGRKLSDETKLKISNSKKGKKNNFIPWNKGLKLSDETINKMKKRVPWNKGIKHSEEAKKKMSEKALLRVNKLSNEIDDNDCLETQV